MVMADWWTNTSLLSPDDAAGAMNPNPLVKLNHRTVPEIRPIARAAARSSRRACVAAAASKSVRHLGRKIQWRQHIIQ